MFTDPDGMSMVMDAISRAREVDEHVEAVTGVGKVAVLVANKMGSFTLVHPKVDPTMAGAAMAVADVRYVHPRKVRRRPGRPTVGATVFAVDRVAGRDRPVGCLRQRASPADQE